MAREWTERQKDAMNTRDRTLLVSAAAGSGKTATLTERIIRSILDESDPIDINRMLIVTFTKAATGELKERIGAAIKGAIASGVASERLEMQLHMLPSAPISTIDSFCSSILKANSERVGVDPGYRIIDPAEAELLSESILDGMFGEIYDGELSEVATPEELEYLSDCLTDTRSQGDLSAIVRNFYDTTKDLPEGVGKIRELVSEYDTERFTTVEETRLGAYAVEVVHEFARHHERVVSECLREHKDSGNSAMQKKIDVLEGDLAYIRALLSERTYNGLRRIAFEREHPRTPNVGKSAPHLAYATEVRKKLKTDSEKMRATFLEYSEEEWRDSYAGLFKVLSVLVRLLEHFHKVYTREKLRISALEYSDVTRYTYECLWQNGERTDVALGEAARYRAIYVDEYQDVNALQHMIFEAISTPENRFMVGDIKQSIYGFRGADPSIFARMKTGFKPLGAEGDRPAASIFMSENFRCDRGVIDFVNEIFDTLFLKLRDSIGFLPEDRLVFKKKYDGEEPLYKRPEMCLLPFRTDGAGLEDEDADEDLCAAVVAAKIRELLAGGKLNDGSPIKPSDIAIIMRNTRGKDSKYAAALEREGIPSAISNSESFFLSADILLLMSILHAIDNPRRDIYLASAMCSPIFGFNADEMVAIAALGAPTLYDGLLAYAAENPDHRKSRRLLDQLARYRTAAEGCAIDVLISRIYRETGILALSAKHGGRESLLCFLEHARQFESSSYRGLYNFIHYINGIIDRQNAFDKREAALGGDEVKIITAHSSKGLEFPVVFFVGAEQAMKRSGDSERRLIYDHRFGIAMQLRTPSGLSLVSNPTKNILLDFTLRRRIEEEARVLYVILTRARERLYVVGKARRNIEKYREDIPTEHKNLSLHSVYSMANYIDMIAYSSGCGFMEADEFLEDMPERLRMRLYPPEESVEEAEDGNAEFESESFSLPDGVSEGLWESDIDDAPLEDAPSDEALEDILLRRFGYEYPYEHETKIPRKLSVSRIYPTMLDPTTPEDALLVGEKERITKMGRLPVFATGSDETESARRGIATHLLFQFADLERLSRLGAREEVERLEREHYLSGEDAKRVRIPEVEAFRRSPLFSDMLGARRIWRELRFNTRLPAELLATDPLEREKLRGSDFLVQGVIDCLYEDADGGLHLIDYKTDRLTREERENPALAEERLRRAHTTQLSYYAMAVERMFGRRPKTVGVYSLHLGRTVELG